MRNVRNVRNVKTEVHWPEKGMPHFAQFADSAATQNPKLTRMDIDASQISLSSLALVENRSAYQVEVFSMAAPTVSASVVFTCTTLA